MAERTGNLLLPVSITRVWVIEILSHGMLYRFERDPAGLWFHHVGQHVHAPSSFVHQADPKLASLLGCSIAVEAHQINLTTARIVVSPDRIVEVEIAIKGSDADRVARTRVFDDATGLVRPAALTAASAIIVAYVEGHTTVLGEDGVSCRPGAAGVAPDGDGVVVRVPWFCVGVADPLRYRSTVLIDVSPDARQVVL